MTKEQRLLALRDGIKMSLLLDDFETAKKLEERYEIVKNGGNENEI